MAQQTTSRVVPVLFIAALLFLAARIVVALRFGPTSPLGQTMDAAGDAVLKGLGGALVLAFVYVHWTADWRLCPHCGRTARMKVVSSACRAERWDHVPAWRRSEGASGLAFEVTRVEDQTLECPRCRARHDVRGASTGQREFR